MSHNVTIKDIKVTDMSAMAKAVKELCAEGIDMELVENGQYRGYSAMQSGNYPWVLKLNKGKYDVAFTPAEDGGGFVPVFDPYGNHVRSHCGYPVHEMDKNTCNIHSPSVHIGKLMQRYCTVLTENAAAMQGLTTQRDFDPASKTMNVVITNY